MELKGKTALVTGGGIRVGKAIALALAAEGTNLIIHYNRSQDPAEETAAQARSLGTKAITLDADFNNPKSIESLFPRALSQFKTIDILVNSAAIYLRGKGLDTDRQAWETQFRINLKAPFLLTQDFARQLPKGLPGRVLNIADAQINQHRPDHFAYRLTKLSLVEMTRMFALELAPDITVNALGLGIMLPLADREDVDLEAYAEKNVPLNRTGSPEIAAQNALHLIKSSYTTGAFLVVDGGQYI